MDFTVPATHSAAALVRLCPLALSPSEGGRQPGVDGRLGAGFGETSLQSHCLGTLSCQEQVRHEVATCRCGTYQLCVVVFVLLRESGGQRVCVCGALANLDWPPPGGAGPAPSRTPSPAIPSLTPWPQPFPDVSQTCGEPGNVVGQPGLLSSHPQGTAVSS